jgi:hypothetical protein
VQEGLRDRDDSFRLSKGMCHLQTESIDLKGSGTHHEESPRISEKDRFMQTKKYKAGDKQPKLRCPNCHKRLNREATPKELRLYGQSIRPQYGDLTLCDGCDAVLEYTSDPAALTLRIAPQWRSDLLNDMRARDPSLAEVVHSIQDRKPLRILANTILLRRYKAVK